VDEAPIAELHQRVRSGALHLALCFGDLDATSPAPDAGVHREDLFVEPMLAALAPRHPLARNETVKLRQLADEDWIAPTRDHLIVRACRAAGFEPRIAFLASDPAAIRALVAQRIAVTVVPSLLADHMHGTALREIAPDPPRRQIYALTSTIGLSDLGRLALDTLRRTGEHAARDRNRSAEASG
jgi:DNA-binding transcriptional LysR family regulator